MARRTASTTEKTALLRRCPTPAPESHSAQTIDLRPGADTFTSVAPVRVYDAHGKTLLTTGWATAAGHRFE
ncbi:MAG: hypothetical protein ABIQ52_15010 [Vicinamibacterales bacterium]